MNHLIMVDVCRLSGHCIAAVKHLRAASNHSTLLAFGVPPRIGIWEARARQSERDRFIRPTVQAKGATKVILTLEAARLQSEYKDWQWTLVGNDRAYHELVTRLEADGVDIDYYPTLCLDEARAVAGEHAPMAQKLRELYSRIQAEQGWESVQVGQFANRAVQAYPELRKPSRRVGMFGSRRFPAIAQAVGLRVKGNFIVGLA